jgi:hypothetical protein
MFACIVDRKCESLDTYWPQTTERNDGEDRYVYEAAFGLYGCHETEWIVRLRRSTSSEQDDGYIYSNCWRGGSRNALERCFNNRIMFVTIKRFVATEPTHFHSSLSTRRGDDLFNSFESGNSTFSKQVKVVRSIYVDLKALLNSYCLTTTKRYGVQIKAFLSKFISAKKFDGAIRRSTLWDSTSTQLLSTGGISTGKTKKMKNMVALEYLKVQDVI